MGAICFYARIEECNARIVKNGLRRRWGGGERYIYSTTPMR